MAIQMIGAAAPYIASSVGSVVISASLSLLILKITGWAERAFKIQEPGPIGTFAFIALLFGLGAVSSYALTSVLLTNHSYATFAKVGNVVLSLMAGFGGLCLEEYIPDIPVNKGN